MGIRVLPPDVNTSDTNFTPDGPTRSALGSAPSRTSAADAVESIINARHEGGRSRRSTVLRARRPGRGQSPHDRMLIKAGAMDSLEGTRSQLFDAIDSAIETAARSARQGASGQSGLFSAMFTRPERSPSLRCPMCRTGRRPEKLPDEKELLGFYVTGHPLDEYHDKVTELATHTTRIARRPGEGDRTQVLRHPHGPAAPPQQGRQALGQLCRSKT